MKYTTFVICGAILLMLKYFFYSVNAANAGGQFTFESNPQAYCLAQNIYYETRGSNYADQLAVSYVVINRVISSKYPDSICEVVKQAKLDSRGLPIRDKCQFSWYCDGKSDRIHDMTTFSDIFDFTLGLVDGTIKVMDVTQGATHYHADYVSPAWAKTKTKTIEIEDHIFYRWEKTE